MLSVEWCNISKNCNTSDETFFDYNRFFLEKCNNFSFDPVNYDLLSGNERYWKYVSLRQSNSVIIVALTLQ